MPGHRLVSGEQQDGDHGDHLFVVEVVPLVGGGEGRDQVVPGWSRRSAITVRK